MDVHWHLLTILVVDKRIHLFHELVVRQLLAVGIDRLLREQPGVGLEADVVDFASSLPQNRPTLIPHLNPGPVENGVSLVVRQAVLHHEVEVGLVAVEVLVLERVQLARHRLEIHRLLDVIQIIRDVIKINRLSKDLLRVDLPQLQRHRL